MRDKPQLALGLMSRSELIEGLEKKLVSLMEKQNTHIDAVQKDLQEFLVIDSMNFETKQLYWRKKKQIPAQKLVRKIRSVMAREFGKDACQWQYKISGENDSCS